MTYKEYIISTLHKLYRNDPWLNELYNAVDIELKKVDATTKEDYDNIFFNSLTEYGCKVFEKDLGIIPARGSSLEQRRKIIKSKWLSRPFCSLPILQSIADVHFNGGVKVSYDGDATLTYTTLLGFNYFDTDKTIFEKSIDDVKPAHFDSIWKYSSNIWGSYFIPNDWQRFLENAVWASKLSDTWEYWSKPFFKKNWDYCLNRNWKEMLYEEVI